MVKVKPMGKCSLLKTGLLQQDQFSIKLPSRKECFKNIYGDLVDEAVNAVKMSEEVSSTSGLNSK